MRTSSRVLFIMLICIIISIKISYSQDKGNGQVPQIKDKTAGMEKVSGYFDFYYDSKADKIFLEVEKFEAEFLYVNSLPAGIGSNDIGLDRGQLGNTRVVKFQRFGPKIMLTHVNYGYRAITDNFDEKKSVEQAFAQSIIGGFKIEAQTRDKVLIDLTNFLIRDAHNVIGRLKSRNQGNYNLDKSRSATYMEMTKNFPRNTEFEVTLTYSGNATGRWIRSVTPTPGAITVRQHHSFVQLPDNNYKPRKFDPRAGYGRISYLDYATPISEPIRKQFIARHRLSKKNPTATVSEAVEPIIYYLDRGAPEPIRSALLDGARWWNQAFEVAGYKDAFQVKILPEGADPMDVRYNLIQWVHRSTRGWSYGSSVRDPRTGEIIKGQVSLGSLRVRQDFLIAEGLLAPYEDGETVPPEMEEMALARLRQLAAHEVGHTLGLSHNYAASVNNRASVMDYPHPMVKLDANGKIDLSDAYDVNIGEWDKVAITYGYQEFPEGSNEAEGLNKILNDAYSEGLRFISDQDARPTGSAHPNAHLWDNGTHPADELNHIMEVRSVALGNFSEKNIRKGFPMATLEEVLVPIYFLHRYQIEAAAKMVGGQSYNYALRGDGQLVTEIVDAVDQRKAMDALINTLTPEALAIPENILKIIPPRALGYNRSRENFKVRTGLTFDPMGAAETAANMTASFIFHPQRAARLVEYHSRNTSYPGLDEVIDKVISNTWKSTRKADYHGEIQNVVDQVVLQNLMKMAANENASSRTKSISMLKLDELKKWLVEQLNRTKEDSQKAHYLMAFTLIEQFQRNPKDVKYTPLSPPDGSPIGMGIELYGCYQN